MRTVSLFLIFFLTAEIVNAGLVFQNGKTEKSYDGQGVPFIVLSSTYTETQHKDRYLETNLLSVLNDGSCFLNVTINNQNNLSLPKAERKLTLNKYGPKMLPEKVRAVLQHFFSESYNLSLIPKAYLPNFPPEKKGVWLAELKLTYGESDHTCYLSSSNPDYPKVSIEGEEFILFLHRVMDWMKQNPNH